MEEFDFGIPKNDFYTGWKPVDKTIITASNKKLNQAEYFNSFIYQQYNGMLYKVVNGELVIIKLAPIMGYYNAIRYCGVYGSSEETREMLIQNGITLRGSEIEGGKEDSFGKEFVYDTDEFIKMKGKEFARIRNEINKKQEFFVQNNFSICKYDILNVIKKWSEATSSKHQLKLFELIVNNKELIKVTVVYDLKKTHIIGFSIVEIVNEQNGIIIQQLINPEVKDNYNEPNIIIHYHNCINNRGMKLNIGGARNEKIRVAKSKLVPCLLLPIYRRTTAVKLTKDIYNRMKNE